MSNEYDSIDNFFNNKSQARVLATLGASENPDNAARAIQLSRTTGVPAPVIMPDLDNFDRNTRSAMAGDIIENNPALSNYVNNSPMAASVSNDDYAQLDTVSNGLAGVKRSFLDRLWDAAVNTPGAVAGSGQKTFEAFREGFGEGPLGSWLMRNDTPQNPAGAEFVKNHPSAAIAYAILGAPIEIPARLFGGALAAVKAEIENETGDPRLAREIAGFLEYQMNKPQGTHVVPGGALHSWMANEQLRQMMPPEVQEGMAAAQAARPYISAGREPPPGIDKVIDGVKETQAKIDVDAIADLTKESQKSTTRERSPEMFQEFVEQQTQARIYVPFDAVAKLYGEKIPEATDNLLGWVPDLMPQLRTMSLTGGDIVIPLAQWLAKVDPEVMKALHDDVRVRRNGITIEEGKVLKEYAAVEREPSYLPAAQLEEASGRAVEGVTDNTGNFITSEEATSREAQAVVAVRKQAQLQPINELAKTEGTPSRTPIAGEEVRRYGRNTTAYILPTEKWHPIERIIDAEVDKILKRIAPEAEHQGAQELEMKGMGKVQGAYLAYNDRAPIILWAMDAKDPFRTARHEAIHFLRDNDFFTEGEWKALRKAAIEENWLDKHRINERSYKDLPPEIKIEEAIAEEYSHWAKNPENVKASLRRTFEKLHMLLVEIKEAIQKALGYEPKAEELFQMVESGEIGARYGQEPIGRTWSSKAQAQPVQGELDVTRQNDKAIFDKAAAIGMTVDQYNRYLKLIEKRNLEDIQAQRQRAEAFERKRQTAQWKADAAEMEDTVRADLRNRPDIAAADFFRYGELYGQKLEAIPKLDSVLLAEEQRKLLPQQWLREGGMHPDDAASLFGYPSGADLVQRLSEFESARGNVRPGEFFHRLVKAETERRMVARYGELDRNILAAAEDHVLGATQMDLLHEETAALGMRAGAEISFKKEDVQQWVAERFNEARARDVGADRFLNEAGKAGRAAEMALLKGDYTEAFRQKQRQYFAAALAKEARAFERETEKFERVARRFVKRDVKGIDQEYTDFIQGLMLQVGYPVRRSMEEIRTAVDRHGFNSFGEFVGSKIGEGWELEVQPYIQQGLLKPLAEMTTQETREFRTAIRSLAHVGREVNGIEIAGRLRDFAEFRDEVINNIKSLPPRPDNANNWFYKFDAAHTRMEEVMKDLDLRAELGPLFNAVIRPMAEAKHTEYTMLEDLSRRLTQIKADTGKGWQKSLQDTIPQNFIISPRFGIPFDLSRENMINIMLNFGNRSNIEKFVNGWAQGKDAVQFEAQLRQLFDQHATKKDWEFVQAIWDIWKPWQTAADEMYYKLSGVPPKWIDPVPVDTPHGQFPGGYFPLLRDHWNSGKPNISDAALFGPNHHRATPTNHYTRERGGASYFVDFQGTMEQVASKMQQEVHDISYRQAIIDVRKVLTDKEIKQAIRHHYGPEYEAQLDPWVRRIASHFDPNEEAVGVVNDALRRVRYNLMGHALGLSLKVLLSPDVGLLSPRTVKDVSVQMGANLIWRQSENTKLAMEKSLEIQHTFRNIDRDFRERLEHAIKQRGFSKFQADAVRWAFGPVIYLSQQLRISTFIGKYREGLAKGMSEGDAVAFGDSFVRERHGATGLPDLPAVMTSNEAMKTYTMFYGFFNTMTNWQRQIPGQLRRGEYKDAFKTAYGAVLIPSLFGALLFNKAQEDDSWFKRIGKAIPYQVMSSWLFLRDLGSLTFEGFPSRTAAGTLMQSWNSLKTDVQRYVRKERVQKPITHTANAIGLSTGLPLAQIGRTSQFLYDVNKGYQRPRNIFEWSRGFIQGEAREKKGNR